MKNAAIALICGVTFIFISRALFTIFPNFIRNNFNYVVIISLLYLIANALPIWFFMEFRKETTKQLKLSPALELLLLFLGLNLIDRILTVLLTINITTLFLEKILFQIRSLIPLFLYLSMSYFFHKFYRESNNSKFSQLSNVMQFNRIGFGLLALFTAIGLIDQLTGGIIYNSMSGSGSPLKMLSYLVIIFVYYASLRFYLGIYNLAGESS